MRSVILLAGDRLAGRAARLLALVLIVGGVMLALAAHERGSPVLAVPAAAAILGALYAGMRRREVRFDPARGVVEQAVRVLNSERVERTPLSRFDRVLLEALPGKQEGYYALALRGPGEREVSLASGVGDHGEAIAAAMHAAEATGLPLDEKGLDGRVARLRAEQLATLEAEPPHPGDELPWWRRPSAIALLVANVVPLLGVVFLGWQVLPIMLLFWLENLIIGAYTMARILMAPGGLPNLALCIFFGAHYGMFAFGHGLFIMVLFGGRKTLSAAGPLQLPELVGEALFRHGLAVGALALAVSHGISFFRNYVATRAYAVAEPRQLMMAPYKRVFVLHIVIIASGMLVQALGAPAAALALLVVLKTAIDLAAHVAEHRAPLVRDFRTLMANCANDKPLSNYFGTWRLAPGEHSPPGWFAGIVFMQNGSRFSLRLTSQPGARAGEKLEAAEVRGDAGRVESIEVRVRGGGKRRVLRFTASGTDAGRIDLHEVQHPEGKPRDAQARSFSLVRSAAPA